MRTITGFLLSVALLACACAAGQAADQISSSAETYSLTGEANPARTSMRPPFSTRIEQTATLEGIKIAASYDAHFDPASGRFRAEGVIRPFDAADTEGGVKVAITNDGMTLRQLVVSRKPGQPALLCTYDLSTINRSFPDFDPSSAFCPLAWSRLISSAGEHLAPAKGVVRGDSVLIFTIAAEGKIFVPIISPSATGRAPIRLPDLQDVAISVAEKDGIPRHVEMRGKNGETLMTVDYKDLTWARDFPDTLVRIDTPPGAIQMDGTPLLTSMLDQDAEAIE